MRWRIDFAGRFDRYVDADGMRHLPRGGVEFARRDESSGDGFVIVLTVTGEVLPYMAITRMPSLRMVGGPKDGQVGAAPEKVPDRIHFQPVVALGEDGEALAPVPPGWLRGPNDTYVHHPTGCPCHGMMSGPVEHLYVWPATLAEQVAAWAEREGSA